MHETALHHTALHQTAPHETAPHGTAPHGTAPHETAPGGTAGRSPTDVVAPGPSPAPWTEIGVFLAATAAMLTATTTVAVAHDADVTALDAAPPLVQAVLFGQALIPFVAALLARLVTGGSIRRPGWGVRRAPWRSIGTAWLWGWLTALAGGALVWATGLGGVDRDGLGIGVLLGLTVLALPYVALALAEDVGWRGLLVTRLAQVAGPRTVVAVSGVAWAVFHWPLVLFVGGAPDGVPIVWTLLCTTLGSVAFGAVLASMQLRWGIWPGVVAHAAVNAVLYHVLDPLTADSGSTGWFAGETGLLGALALGAGALVWWRRAPLRAAAGGGTEVGPRG